MGARYYDASQGRFTTRDTVSGNVAEPWTCNLYQYCKNSPQNYVDPTGHNAVVLAAMGIGGISSLLAYQMTAGQDYTSSGAWGAFIGGAIRGGLNACGVPASVIGGALVGGIQAFATMKAEEMFEGKEMPDDVNDRVLAGALDGMAGGILGVATTSALGSEKMALRLARSLVQNPKAMAQLILEFMSGITTNIVSPQVLQQVVAVAGERQSGCSARND